jgi:hypothetical protein
MFFRNTFVRLMILAGSSALFLLWEHSFAATLPPTYMPHYVRVYADAKAFTNTWDGIPDGSLTQDTGWESTTSTGTAGAGITASSPTAVGSTWAAVTVGTSRGVADATANYQAGKFARGIADAWVYWGDTLTVTSATLPNGTPVTLLFTQTLDATTYTSSPLWAYGVNDAEASSTFWIGNDVNSTLTDTITYRDTAPASHQTTRTLFTSVGSQLWIHGETYFDALAAAGSTTPSVYTFANVADTAHFNVDVQTAGASYSTHSGVSYVTVPEPGALMILAIALASVVGRRRRSR